MFPPPLSLALPACLSIFGAGGAGACGEQSARSGEATLPALPPGKQRDETAREFAFVEVVPPARAPFEGEAFVLRLRAGVDVDVLESSLVQLFRQRLDLPLQLSHPWFDGAPPGVAALGPARPAKAADGDAATFQVALGPATARASRHTERGPNDRRFTVLELERTFVAEAPGRHAIPEPRLGFAYATKFRDDLVAGRVPLDRHDAFVRGAARELEVRALPEEGQPYSFTGAVGEFRLTATVSPERAARGETIHYRLTLESLAPSAPLRAPRLDRLGRFRVVAATEAREGDRLDVDVQLVAEAEGVLPIAPVEFAYFDPAAMRYVVLETPALRVEVDGARAVAAREPRPAPEPESPFAKLAPYALLAAAAVVAILVAAAARRRGSSVG